MSNKKQIVFRADGNSKTGLGHLFRLFAIVEMVKTDYDYVYFTKPDSTISVIPKQYNYKILPEDLTLDEEPLWLSKKFKPEQTIIIADGYQFNSIYQKRIKKHGFKLVYIDDLASEHMYADVVINHSPHVKKTDFTAEPYTKFALGTKYAILRPLFLKAAKQERTINKIDTAFVCFGGADPFNLTLKAVRALLKMPQFTSIHVVLGGAYSNDEIFELEKVHPNKLKSYKNLSEEALLKVMQRSNFAIAPASTILYEICCVKMPILSGYYVANQELIYKGFNDKKAIYRGGNLKNYCVNEFKNILESILKEEFFINQVEVQNKLFDCKIVFRHLNLIENLC